MPFVKNPKTGKNEFIYYLAKGSEWAQLKDVIKGDSGEKKDEIWSENYLIEGIRSVDGIFVNDAFLPLWDKTDGLLFLDGGYGSSKTTYAITRLLVKCLSNKYFKCFYGREKKTEARYLHSNIITEIKRNGWEQYFTFSDKPTGSPEIYCNVNGNKFELFGCDDVASLKGWDNPTDVLIDEINQISFEAFGMIYTRLRKPGCELQLTGCFNNCDVFPDHWLVRYIYGNEDSDDEEVKIVLDSLRSRQIIRHHSVYTDNLFQNPDKYRHQLNVQAGGNLQKIAAYLNGEWGVKLNGQPYYKQFNADVHIKDVKYDPSLPIHFVFDENVNPYFPCLIAQLDGNDINIIDEIAAENPNNTLAWMCREITQKYKTHKAGIYIYGDATSKKEDVKQEKGKNLFTIAADYLKHFHPTLRVSDANPNNKIRQDFVNAIFGLNYGFLFIRISPKCKHLIEDLNNCEENPDGKKGGKNKVKEMVNGIRGVQRYGHFGDCLDYLLCEAYMNWYLKFQSGDVTYAVTGGQRPIGNHSLNQSDSNILNDVSEQDLEIKTQKRNKRYIKMSRNSMN